MLHCKQEDLSFSPGTHFIKKNKIKNKNKVGYVVTPAFDPNKAEADGSLQLKASLIYIATVYCKFQDNQGYIEGPCPLKKKKTGMYL